MSNGGISRVGTVSPPAGGQTVSALSASESGRGAATSVEKQSPVKGPQQPASSKETTATNPQPSQASAEELQRASKELQRRIQQLAPELVFTIDQASGRSIIKITDPETKEVIRQIPSEDALRLNQALDQFQGLLLDRKG